MQQTYFVTLFIILFVVVGCGNTLPTTTPVVVETTPTSVVVPSATKVPEIPTLMPTSTSTQTPTPTPEISWHCYDGGIDCYTGFFSVRMLDENHGWLVNDLSAFKYTTTSEGTPVWQRVPGQRGARSLHIIGPDEWWGASLTPCLCAK